MVVPLLIVLVLLGSALLTWGALRYARRRQLFDMPGQRRSHTTPTPRGGGVGIVLALLLAWPLMPWDRFWLPFAVAVALTAVAAIGWLDDHRSLSAKKRLAVHVAAALLVVVALFDASLQALSPWLWLPAVLLAAFWLTGCINAWNFMDGSNGLVASQCVWLGVMLAQVFHSMSADLPASAPWMLVAWALAAACTGFLPFNFPRAAIFLGDVGSGFLGLCCGVLLLVAFWLAPSMFWPLLLLPSVLLVDATMTLIRRIFGRRRWYTAHREHLYQWLIRSGCSHAQVALLYLGWNLAVILPAYHAAMRWPGLAMPLVLAVLTCMAGLWWAGKNTVLRHVRSRHVAARESIDDL